MNGRDIVFALHNALLASEQRAADAQARCDTLYELMASVPWQAPEGAPNALSAFDLLVRYLEGREDREVFEPAMLTGEVLAGCALASKPHAALLARWAASTKPGPRLAVLRACAKLCEYDTTLVDAAMLTALTQRDDLSPLTLGYLSQVAGRLRGEDKGGALIELLASGDAQRRVYAAHAITYSIAMDPPFAKLSVFRQWGPSRFVSEAPSRRLLRLLPALLDDADLEVAQAARQAAEIGRVAWPEINPQLVDILSSNLHREEPSPAPPLHAPGVDFALRLPGRYAQSRGKLNWDHNLIAEERADVQAGTPLPRALGAPRLFLSYRWSDGRDWDLVLDETAGRLHMSGYDIVFDRDPRHLDAGRSADDVLQLLRDCTHFVACITDDLCRYFARDARIPKTALDLEWELAAELANSPAPLQPLALWFGGEPLPNSAQRWPVADLRESKQALDALFPECQFEVRAFNAANQRTFRSKPLKRGELRAAYLHATARRQSARVEIHDITARLRLAELIVGTPLG